MRTLSLFVAAISAAWIVGMSLVRYAGSGEFSMDPGMGILLIPVFFASLVTAIYLEKP